MANLLTDWSLIGPFMTKGIIFFILLAIVGFIIGKFTYHEPRDDVE